MTEPRKGKCNKCGAEYTAAPVGVVHKCGSCSGGRVVVEGRESPFILAAHLQSPTVSFTFTEKEMRDKVEKDIVSWLNKRCDSPTTSLDKFTLRYIIRSIEDDRYGRVNQ
jgi:DNA-directed RNA polymerase subunit RPC12/RpoP